MAPWEFFKDGEVDVVLWPGYWGWEQGEEWNESCQASQWKVPLIQANFAFNDVGDERTRGPHGPVCL
jgi:hypothetical protein